ncbi:DUF4351 domain-containing protein [Synechococcus elongatus]|uniref:DUF4351 domain-containing protein n=1 Tax=Synechococcus elongatus TaxID=32046 RepID=UPI000F7E80E4
MPYVTSLERIGQRRREVRFALQLLTRRFCSLPSEIQTHIEELTIEQLNSLSVVILHFETIADLEA